MLSIICLGLQIEILTMSFTCFCRSNAVTSTTSDSMHTGTPSQQKTTEIVYLKSCINSFNNIMTHRQIIVTYIHDENNNIVLYSIVFYLSISIALLTAFMSLSEVHPTTELNLRPPSRKTLTLPMRHKPQHYLSLSFSCLDIEL